MIGSELEITLSKTESISSTDNSLQSIKSKDSQICKKICKNTNTSNFKQRARRPTPLKTY